MTARSGTNALVLESRRSGLVQIGKLGTLELQPGFFVYVGRAHGPGGVATRRKSSATLSTNP